MKINISIILFIALISNTYQMATAKLTPLHKKTGNTSRSHSQKSLDHIQEKKVEDADVFHKSTLYWYRHFVGEMGQSPHHHNGGLTGYESEEELRMKRDGNLDRIDALARRESYTKRNVQHKTLKFKNELERDRASLHSEQLMATQRTTAIKFEINHDIMWRNYYKERLVLNQKRLQSAGSQTSRSIKALMKNDKQRMEFYWEHAREQWNGLKKVERKSNLMTSTIARPLKKMTAKISSIRLAGMKKIRKLQEKIRELREQNVPIEAALKKYDRDHPAKRRGTKVDTELSSLIGKKKPSPRHGPTSMLHLPQEELLAQDIGNYWE